MVAAPFITSTGADLVLNRLSAEVRTIGRLGLITDLSPIRVCDGSLDVNAVVALGGGASRASVCHIRCLHAKVYIADGARAIVTSGNLTAGAFFHNVEYGLEVTDENLAGEIRSHFADIQSVGTDVPQESLRQYAAVAGRVRETYERQSARIDPSLRSAFSHAVRQADDELIRLRLSGGAMHTVFARTVLMLLRRFGPLATETIHHHVKQLHPDLCDDSVDRVIDGKRFGKKWKHAVRTAQQQLKKRTEVAYDGRLWRIAGL